MTQDDIRKVITRWLEAQNQKDPIAVVAEYAEDCVLVGPAVGTVTGRAAVETVFRNWFMAFPDVTIRQEDLWVFRDQVVFLFTAQGTDTGGFLGQAPTGKPFSLFMASFFTLRERLIVRHHIVYDFTGLLLQLVGEIEVASE